jgi:hypothetical protein
MSSELSSLSENINLNSREAINKCDFHIQCCGKNNLGLRKNFLNLI